MEILPYLCIGFVVFVLIMSLFAGRIAAHILDAPNRVRKWAKDADKLDRDYHP